MGVDTEFLKILSPELDIGGKQNLICEVSFLINLYDEYENP
jgi:hypothetical protein